MTDDKGAKRLCVLKFGSSVLANEADYRAAALEIYRHVRDGEKVVAVVSALAGETDALLAQAGRVGGEAPDGLVARLARVGELQSAALMALALARTGVRSIALDPHEVALQAEGSALDSNLVSLDADAMHARFDDHDVIVVPGFTAGHSEHGVVTLGRGGTDLSAVFFAAQLGASRVRLIKDVAGVYAEDPARNPDAELFSRMSYEDAAEASSGLIQPKAILAAEAAGLPIEIASLGAAEGTVVAAGPTVKARPAGAAPLRVALLGCGSVGAGVLDHLLARPDLFALNPVLVRQATADRGPARFTTDPHAALAGDPDIIVECLGGADWPAEIMRDALRRGAMVVTANKAAVARHYDALHAAADAGAGALAYSGAVGGGTPILETIERLGDDVIALEGVMNGTCNFLLSKLGEGWAFVDAVKTAQELGFAEADPAADVDGHDAADKLSLLVRRAFGVALPPALVPKRSLRDVSPAAAQAALAAGMALKQVGRCRVAADGTLEASVAIEALRADHPLAGARNEENRFLVTDQHGMVHGVFGKGAGRWPTATAVFADVMDMQRRAAARATSGQAQADPVLLRA